MIVISDDIDAAGLASLRSLFWRDQFVKGAYAFPDVESEDFVSECGKLLKSRWNKVCVASAGGAAVGYLFGSIIMTPAANGSGRLFRINEIYVIEEYRRHAMASKLLNAMVDELSDQPVDAIELDVLERNIEGIAFWQRHGFAVTLRTLRKER